MNIQIYELIWVMFIQTMTVYNYNASTQKAEQEDYMFKIKLF